MEEPGGLQSRGSLRVGHDFTFTFTFHFDALEKEMATHSSVLAWRIPGTGEPGGLRSMESHRVGQDRKSTRLNSSHQLISYAVFCLKKKTNNAPSPYPQPPQTTNSQTNHTPTLT